MIRAMQYSPPEKIEFGVDPKNINIADYRTWDVEIQIEYLPPQPSPDRDTTYDYPVNLRHMSGKLIDKNTLNRWQNCLVCGARVREEKTVII